MSKTCQSLVAQHTSSVNAGGCWIDWCMYRSAHEANNTEILYLRCLIMILRLNLPAETLTFLIFP